MISLVTPEEQIVAVDESDWRVQVRAGVSTSR